MTKQVLCVGINNFKNFPDNSLYGCVNDATDMAEFFSNKGLEVTLLLNEQATYDNIMDKLESMAWDSDEIYFSMSSHGSHVPDISGDEPDKVDECFLCYDTDEDFKNVILDDEIYQIFHGIDAKIEIWLDTCSSGTGAKFVLMNQKAKPKFISNPAVKKHATLNTALKSEFLHENSNVILWSGCRADESSYDTEYDGRPNGAFTYNWLKCWPYYHKKVRRTYHNQVASLITKDYPQHPQLEASLCNKIKRLSF